MDTAPSAYPSRRRPARSPRQPPLTPLRLAIALLLQYPGLAQAAGQAPDDWRRLDSPGIPLLAAILDAIATRPDLSAGALMERWRDTPEAPHLARLSDPGLVRHIPADGVEPEFLGALAILGAEARSRDQAALLNRLSPSQWSEEDKRRLRAGLADRPEGPDQADQASPEA